MLESRPRFAAIDASQGDAMVYQRNERLNGMQVVVVEE